MPTKRKPGKSKKSWTTPEELKFLQDHEDAYIEHQTSNTVPAFYRALLSAWFRTFPEIDRLFPGLTKEQLDSDQTTALTNAYDTRQQQLRNWYQNHTATKLRARARATAVPVPVVQSKPSRALQEVEMYSSLYYTTRVKDPASKQLTEEQRGNVSKVRDFTAQMYSAEPEEIKESVRNAVQEQHEARKKTKEEQLTKKRTPPTAREKQEALRTVLREVDTFFTDLNRRTGWAFMCLGGGSVPMAATPDTLRCITFHVGKDVSGQSWEDVYPGFQANVRGPFGHFLQGIYTNQVNNANPSGSNSVSDAPFGYSSVAVPPLSVTDLDIDIAPDPAALPSLDGLETCDPVTGTSLTFVHVTPTAPNTPATGVASAAPIAPPAMPAAPIASDVPIETLTAPSVPIAPPSVSAPFVAPVAPDAPVTAAMPVVPSVSPIAHVTSYFPATLLPGSVTPNPSNTHHSGYELASALIPSTAPRSSVSETLSPYMIMGSGPAVQPSANGSISPLCSDGSQQQQHEARAADATGPVISGSSVTPSLLSVLTSPDFVDEEFHEPLSTFASQNPGLSDLLGPELDPIYPYLSSHHQSNPFLRQFSLATSGLDGNLDAAVYLPGQGSNSSGPHALSSVGALSSTQSFSAGSVTTSAPTATATLGSSAIGSNSEQPCPSVSQCSDGRSGTQDATIGDPNDVRQSQQESGLGADMLGSRSEHSQDLSGAPAVVSTVLDAYSERTLSSSLPSPSSSGSDLPTRPSTRPSTPHDIDSDTPGGPPITPSPPSSPRASPSPDEQDQLSTSSVARPSIVSLGHSPFGDCPRRERRPPKPADYCYAEPRRRNGLRPGPTMNPNYMPIVDIELPVRAPVKWLEDAKAFLYAVDLVHPWSECLRLWLQMESEIMVQSASRLGSADQRPEELNKWFTSGRNYAKVPEAEDVKAFGTSWLAWWYALQPQWRLTERGPGNSVLPPAVYNDPSGDWKTLRKGGPTGFVIILVGLAIWAKAAPRARDLKRALNDVHKCLQQIVSAPVKRTAPEIAQTALKKQKKR